MRVLHVVTGKHRGAEFFASDLIRALSGAGVSQRVAVLRANGRPSVAFDAPVEVLGSQEWTVPGIRMRPATFLALRNLFDGSRFDIVQAHGGEALKYSVLADLPRRTSIVYRGVGMTLPRIHRGSRRSVYGWLMRRANRVVAVADVVRRQAIDVYGVPQQRVVTIPNGVDTRRVSPDKGGEETRRALGISASARVVLSLGALTWEKDPFGTIDMAARIQGREPDVVFVMAGDGPLLRETNLRVERAGLRGRVLVLGPRSDVGDLLSASDVLLFASRIDGMEGMPATLIEAGMAGVPAAAYSVAGVPEVITDGRTGLLARPEDTEALEAGLLQLLRDQGAMRDMGRAASERCRALFDIDVVASRYLGLYQEMAIT